MTARTPSPASRSTAATACSGAWASAAWRRVYLAEDRALDRKVALKVMAERYAEDGEFVERFRREAQAAARPQPPEHHRGLRPRRGGRRHYIVMEYLPGPT